MNEEDLRLYLSSLCIVLGVVVGAAALAFIAPWLLLGFVMCLVIAATIGLLAFVVFIAREEMRGESR